jgi:hypothetical protein
MNSQPKTPDQLKVAVALVLPLGTRIEQVVPAIEVQPPVQLTNVCPAFGVAVSTIVSPIVNCAPHAPLGQLIPVGTLVTTPPPLDPAKVTVTTAWVGLPPGQIGLVGSSTVTVA